MVSTEIEKPVPAVRFLCCTKTVERIKSYGQSGLIGDKMTRPFYVDAEGFLICPEHGQRRFAWRTARKSLFPSVPQNLDRPKQFVECINHTETALERDQSVRRGFGL